MVNTQVSVDANSVFLPDGSELRLGRVIAETRACADGVPDEQRTLHVCRLVRSGQQTSEELVVKIKHQSGAIRADSHATKQELQALETLTTHNLSCSPHLVGFQTVEQEAKERKSFLIMAKMPGHNLLECKYWGLGVQERLEIQEHFVKAMLSLRKVGIAPTDRALRNVMWHSESKQLSIVDFEQWETPSAFAMDEERELQLWGLASRPAAATWWDEWKLHNH